MANVLVVGGSSGLGLELARLYARRDHDVFITGRNNPCEKGVNFLPFSLSCSDGLLEERIQDFVRALPEVHTLVHAAGYYQQGRLTDLSASEIIEMINVGLLAPTMFLRTLLKFQNRLHAFVAITSTSQWVPRLLEPVYTAVKAGLAALANSVSLDERVRQVLVAAPSGMATPFWKDGRDTSMMLDATWVATQIGIHLAEGDPYRQIRIFRGPARVEVAESRP